MKKISDRSFTLTSYQLKNVNAGYDNHAVVQEVDAIAFDSQSLSNFTLEELDIPETFHVVIFPECGLSFLWTLPNSKHSKFT